MAAWLKKAGEPGEQLRQALLQVVRESWVRMDTSWEKLDAGFDMLAEIAGTDLETGLEYISEINQLQDLLPLPDEETTVAASMGVLLAVRAFVGLLKFHLEGPDDLERLYATIERCGAISVQAQLLSNLSIRCHVAGRKDLSEEIVRDRLLRLIAATSEDDTAYRNDLIRDSAPALYLGSPAAGRGHIRNLAEPWRDEALGLTAWTLLTKVPPGEAFDRRPHQGYTIDYEDACAVIELLNDMCTDWRISSLIDAVVESTVHSTAEISRPQRADIAIRLENLVTSKFPAPRFIQHEGYRVVGQARINRLRLRSEMTPSVTLAQAARRIPNTADRAYVLGVVGASAKEVRERRALLSEAKDIADSIPMLTDRLDRYEMLSSLGWEIDEGWSRNLLRSAVELACKGEGSSVEQRRRSLINLAYRMGPEFAATLAQISDDDPAKSKMEKQLQIYRIRDAIAMRRPPAQGLPTGSARDFARAAWLRLGLLNAGRISATSAKYALPILQYASTQQLSDGYPPLRFLHRKCSAARVEHKSCSELCPSAV